MTILRWLLILSAGLLLASALVALWPIRGMPQMVSVPADVAVPAASMEVEAEPVRFGTRPLLEPQAVVVEPEPVVPEPARAPDPVPVLGGIASDETGRVAWLALSGQPPAPLRIGETLGGWQVIAIADTSVRLASETGQIELALFSDG